MGTFHASPFLWSGWVERVAKLCLGHASYDQIPALGAPLALKLAAGVLANVPPAACPEVKEILFP